MRKFLSTIMIVFAAVAAPSWASDQLVQEYLSKDLIQRWDRLNTIAWPLLANNAEICPDISGPLAGFTASTLPDGNGQVVFHVADGSPAAEQGLRKGDVLLSVNGKSTTHRKAEKAEENYRERLESALESGQVALSVQRQGAQEAVVFTPDTGCAIELVYTGTATPTIMNERQVMIGTIMENYVRTEDEAAIYLAREFARVILDQAGSNKRFGRGMGAVMGIASRFTGHDLDNAYANRAVGNFFRGKKQDDAADELSLFLVARAGIDVSQAPEFWEHVFENRTGNQALGRLMGNSPGSPERLENLRATTEAILQLQQDGRPLLPQDT